LKVYIDSYITSELREFQKGPSLLDRKHENSETSFYFFRETTITMDEYTSKFLSIHKFNISFLAIEKCVIIPPE
jgi:hypothetical protein